MAARRRRAGATAASEDGRPVCAGGGGAIAARAALTCTGLTGCRSCLSAAAPDGRTPSSGGASGVVSLVGIPIRYEGCTGRCGGSTRKKDGCATGRRRCVGGVRW